jgi:hypothetical protein
LGCCLLDILPRKGSGGEVGSIGAWLRSTPPSLPLPADGIEYLHLSLQDAPLPPSSIPIPTELPEQGLL